MRGGGDLSEYRFLNSADSSSLSEPRTRITPSWSAEFEKSTSAPFVAPVVTITPVPLFYHVYIFYIVHFKSLTTHPSQPTYTFNELQKKELKEDLKKKPPTHKQTNKQTNKQKHTIYIISLVW